jgi:hypothetical protein
MVVLDIGEMRSGQRLQHHLGVRALYRKQADLAGDVFQTNVDAALLRHDVVPGLLGVRCIDHDHQLVIEPVHGTVVHERAFGGKNPGVLYTSRLQCTHIVAGNTVHEGIAVGPGDLELAHV